MATSQNPNSFVLANDLLRSLGGSSAPAQQKKQEPAAPVASCRFLVDQRFPEAQYSIGGLFLYDESLAQLGNFIALLNSAKSDEPKFLLDSFCGAPPCAWNLDWYAARPPISPNRVTEILRKHIDKLLRNDCFALEFDNPFIEESLVDDFIGNSLLKTFATLPRMQVRVASDLLAEHVRKSFPKAEIVASENKVVAEEGRGNVDWYRTMAERFSRVSLHPADACDGKFLEELSKAAPAEKFEVPLNDTCSRNCEVRKDYISVLAQLRREPLNANLMGKRYEILQKLGCETASGAPPDEKSRPALLSREEFAQAYELGFRHFHVQGWKLRSEVAFFWQIFSLTLNDDPKFWHKRAATIAALSMNVSEEVPIVKTGISAFTMRKFD